MDTTKLPSPIRSVLAYRRKARVDFILSKITTREEMNIIDIGCGVDGRSFDDYVSPRWSIAGIDIHSEDRVRHTHPRFSYLRQDAQNLGQFRDGEFDLSISIGMMEHVTDPEVFRRICAEIQRVAKQYIVVVPYRYCWIEPHFGVPFFPLLPERTQKTLVKTLNLSGLRHVLDEDPDHIKKNYQWFTNAYYETVFPGSKIYLLPTLEVIAIVKRAAI
jgi:ubiquinone/menaquinone biosynthesis C-methylase UbiE